MERRLEKVQKPPREERYKHQRENPSFSSTLLDAIYRSIDESSGRVEEDGVVLYRETMRKKQNASELRGEGTGSFVRKKEEEEITSFRRTCMVEKWMERKVSYEKVATDRRKSTAERDSFDRPAGRKCYSADRLMNSSSSSSESSSGGGFSSSESESFHGGKYSKFSTSYRLDSPPPMIRTSVSACPERMSRTVQYNHPAPTHKTKQEGGSFGKTKSRALKIYGDLKKAKQPISPGGRLASFLNSIFTNGNSKKPKFSSSSCSRHDHESKTVKSEQESTCSTASSFSRSCLSNTPSSRGKLSNNGAKRSVRFYPVSVIVDEDSRPCGHKTLYENSDNQYKENSMTYSTTNRSVSPTNEELKFLLTRENRRVEEVARDLLLRSYHNKVADIDQDEHMGSAADDDDEEEEDDDGASYASSDLFELDNLSSIGINGHRYRDDELPVYETTYLTTNRAIKLPMA